jgi:hypothetical protein
MNKKYIVRLTPEDRQTLELLVRRGRVAAYKAKRAWILLQADASADDRRGPMSRLARPMTSACEPSTAFVKRGSMKG